MTRKLLPYEYDLIATLGVSKEEYLEFIALQAAYQDPKEGTILDIRNDAGITAIVLTIIGMLLQVASILLMPKPSAGAGQRQTREERFSPRFGFNTTQELAKYGDTVPLVYTNRSVNPNGGVRLAGALLWSAVRSYGSNQFLQMLMLLAGGKITAIDPSKSAFGQTAVRDLVTQNKWVYFDAGATGTLHWNDELDSNYDNDPTKYGTGRDNPYRLQPTNNANTRVDGFSQAYSPSSANIFGVYSPVPINVRVYLRNEQGDKDSRNLGITMTSWTALEKINRDDVYTVTIASTKDQPLDTDFESDLKRAAIDARCGLSGAFDEGGIFKLGSARLRVSRITGSSTDEGSLTIRLECINDGNAPSAGYNDDEVSDLTTKITESPEYLINKKIVDDLLAIDDRSETTIKAFVSNFLPSDQEFAVTDAQSLLRSGKLFEIVFRSVGTKFGARQVGRFELVRNLTNVEKSQLSDFIDLENSVKIDSDDRYYIKALTRIEEASYNTVSSCNIVDIAMKVQTFKRISGRQRKYGSKERGGYMESDNGIQLRTTLFLMFYRVAGQAEQLVPGIFAVRRAAEQDNYIYVKFDGGNTPQQWQFRFEPIFDPLAEIKTRSGLRVNDVVNYFYLENSGSSASVDLGSNRNVYFTGFKRTSVSGQPPLNTAPNKTSEWDLFSLDADTQLQLSIERGPEFTITAVTEQLRQSFTNALYNNLSLIGFNVFSGKSLQDMRSFSAFVTQGKPVRRLSTSNLSYPSTPNGPTCFAPDIFLDTVLDSADGIGNYARIEGVDTRQLAITKRFCVANELYMDTVIADAQNWRQFWATTAPFSLLEFARIGGRETLVPALPYNRSTGAIDRLINVTSLFNQGNILEDSYKEEFIDYDANSQDIIATVIYRELDSNGIFAVNRSVSVQRKDADRNAIPQDFDASAFVTTRSQAIKIGKLMCNTRHYVRTAIEFKTFPTTSPVEPGAFFYFDIGQNSWDGIRTGVVGPGGKLNIPMDNTVANGSRQFLLYRSGSDVVKQTATVASGIVAAFAEKYEGYLFVLGTATTTRRVFRATQVEMDEEGEVTVRASIYPCDSSGNSLIADFSNADFTVTS